MFLFKHSQTLLLLNAELHSGENTPVTGVCTSWLQAFPMFLCFQSMFASSVAHLLCSYCFSSPLLTTVVMDLQTTAQNLGPLRENSHIQGKS